MTGNQLLDNYEKQNPQPWWRRSRQVTALELAVADLQVAQKEQLHHAGLAEHHQSMLSRYRKSEARLLKDIDRLKQGLPATLDSSTE